MAKQTSSLELADNARGEVADLLDLQLSPRFGRDGYACPATRADNCRYRLWGGSDCSNSSQAGSGRQAALLVVDIAPRVLEVARSRTAASAGSADAGRRCHSCLAGRDGRRRVFSIRRHGTRRPHCRLCQFSPDNPVRWPTCLVCWRSLEENELDLVPLRAAGLDIPIDKTPCKFERRDYLFDVLRSVGFAKIEIKAFGCESFERKP